MLSARSSIPEIELAAAVIQRAWDDALTPDDRLARPRVIVTDDGAHRTFTPGLKPRERDEAVRFLVDTTPCWVGAREAWCDMVGIDPGEVRRRALRRIPHGSLPADLHAAIQPIRIDASAPTPAIPPAANANQASEAA
jgi:hypothetical protein